MKKRSMNKGQIQEIYVPEAIVNWLEIYNTTSISLVSDYKIASYFSGPKQITLKTILENHLIQLAS